MYGPGPVQAVDAASLEGDHMPIAAVGEVGDVEYAHSALGAEIAVHCVPSVRRAGEAGQLASQVRGQGKEFAGREVGRRAVGGGGLLPALGAVAVGHTGRLGSWSLEFYVAALAANREPIGF